MTTGFSSSGEMLVAAGNALTDCCCGDVQSECFLIMSLDIHCNNFPAGASIFPRPTHSQIRSASMCLRHLVWCNKSKADETFQGVLRTDNADYIIRNARRYKLDGTELCPGQGTPVNIPYRPVAWECVDANPCTDVDSDCDISILDGTTCTIKSAGFLPTDSQLEVGGSVTWEKIVDDINLITSIAPYTFVMSVSAYRWRLPEKNISGKYTYFDTSRLRIEIYAIDLRDNTTCYDERVDDLLGKCE
jgi:hypothetical protein